MNSEIYFIFLVTMYFNVKRIAGKFSLICNQELSQKEEVMKQLSNSSLQKDDEPIFKYWVECVSNKQDERPILPNNRSKFGIIVTAL